MELSCNNMNIDINIHITWGYCKFATLFRGAIFDRFARKMAI